MATFDLVAQLLCKIDVFLLDDDLVKFPCLDQRVVELRVVQELQDEPITLLRNSTFADDHSVQVEENYDLVFRCSLFHLEVGE